eukprot:TRINITY_DN99434_c0_g1_i1.p1 TRINITY_DN99434_c0_g1~~TRINITY_DN99434_c0_g1_i1.p1  ORF type:complete len:104 (+),score=45.88 TRINITY_DN99434_c0_g1_i1:37-312(+)
MNTLVRAEVRSGWSSSAGKKLPNKNVSVSPDEQRALMQQQRVSLVPNEPNTMVWRITCRLPVAGRYSIQFSLSAAGSSGVFRFVTALMIHS